MGDTTKIQWATHTFNPWEGCTKVSPGCAHCYAETRNHRFGNDNWGKGHTRRRTSKANWRLPLKWNRDAEKNGARPRIFCASLADWLDDEVPIEWLADLLKLIHETPNCDWLLLTKRPELLNRRMESVLDYSHGHDMPEEFGIVQRWKTTPPVNVWLGVSVEDQQRAHERIPALLNIPARIRFLSVEPMLERVDLLIDSQLELGGDRRIDWVIFGGESGSNARQCRVDWIRDGVSQCRMAGAAPFVKQLGAIVVGNEMDKWVTRLRDKKSGDISEWPRELRVREFPK